MDINDAVMNMPKGWVVQYNDGCMITEYDIDGKQRDWRTVPKQGIKSLSLKWYNKHWTVHGKSTYLQKKRGWITPMEGVDQEPNVQFRYIGYWDGADRVFYRVDEGTGQMQMEVETGASGSTV